MQRRASEKKTAERNIRRRPTQLVVVASPGQTAMFNKSEDVACCTSWFTAQKENALEKRRVIRG